MASYVITRTVVNLMKYLCYLYLFTYNDVRHHYMNNMLYKKQQLLTLHEHLVSPPFFFGGVLIAHLFRFSVLLFLFCMSLFFALCPTLPVSLDCPFLIAPSDFSGRSEYK